MAEAGETEKGLPEEPVLPKGELTEAGFVTKNDLEGVGSFQDLERFLEDRGDTPIAAIVTFKPEEIRDRVRAMQACLSVVGVLRKEIPLMQEKLKQKRAATRSVWDKLKEREEGLKEISGLAERKEEVMRLREIDKRLQRGELKVRRYGEDIAGKKQALERQSSFLGELLDKMPPGDFRDHVTRLIKQAGVEKEKESDE